VNAAAGAALVWCPFGTVEDARAAIAAVLDEGLAACANILPGVESHYVWQGAREQAGEVGVLFKTNCERLGNLVARLDALHPYDQPSILGWRCDVASEATLVWLGGLGE